MDLQEWKQAAEVKLAALAGDLRAGAPEMLYGALSAATLMPIVTAANQGDFAALTALGGVLGSVGGNLIANQIQGWKERSEAEVAAEIKAKAQVDPDWRQALDALLQEFEAPREVQAILSEADRDWFVASLRTELAEIGSGLILDNDGLLVMGDRNVTIGGEVRDSTVITGDNNVVTDTGGGAFVGGDVTVEGGDFVGRDKMVNDEVHGQKVEIHGGTIHIATEVAAALMPALESNASANRRLKSVTQRYLAFLLSRYRYLEFRGMGMADRVALQLPLAKMYVPLRARLEAPRGETWARELMLAGRKVSEEEVAAIGERLSEPQSLVNLLAQHDGLIILGDPGAGKTTFLKYVTLCLASGKGEILGLGKRLPILAPLSAYANALTERDVAFQTFLGEFYRDQGIPLQVDALLEAALDEGRALLMLDGLDEVQSLEDRSLVLDRVATFFAFHKQAGNKFLLTSRIVGYRDVRFVIEGLRECTLVDFDDNEIADFVGKWTTALERAARGDEGLAARAAALEKKELLEATQHNPGVRRLAANPLLLTILALMKRQGVTLPDRRVELYDTYVETLLRHWNLARSLSGRRLTRELDVLETTRVLAPLALWMHRTSPGVGLVKRREMLRELARIYWEREEPKPEQAARQLLHDVQQHASLLLERGPSQYGFIHLTFQEYLAAVAIAQLGQSDVGPVADLLAAHVADDTWREVSLLTIGYMGLIQQRDEAAGETLEQLIGSRAGEPGAAVVLAGEAVVDTHSGGVTVRCRRLVADQLLATMLDDTTVAPAMRARAGSILGALGDTRKGVGLSNGVPDIAWIRIDSENSSTGTQTANGVSNCESGGLCLSRYPITNEQYSAFLKAEEQKEYQAPAHWHGDAPPLEIRNHPVRNISWFDARNFCVWLASERQETVRLPAAREWERAARSSDLRRYPWGDAPPNENICNFGSRLGATSPVGMYPCGISPHGCDDMAGNVWEWTTSYFAHDEPTLCIDSPIEKTDSSPSSHLFLLRGGSYSSNESALQCYFLNPTHPLDGLYNHGFRVACSNPKEVVEGNQSD